MVQSIFSFALSRRVIWQVLVLVIVSLSFAATAGAQTVWEEIPLFGQTPGSRFGHTMTDVEGTIYLFGGAGSADLNTQFNDLWRYEPATRSFVKVVPANTPPPARHGHAAASADGKLFVLFGVNRQQGVLADIWSYDPSTNLWEQRPSLPASRILPEGNSQTGAPIDVPPKRSLPGIIGVPDPNDPSKTQLIIIAGLDENGQPLGDVWIYDVKNSRWVVGQELEILLYSIALFAPRLDRVGDIESERLEAEVNKLVLFGGEGLDGVKDDVLTLDLITPGAKWTFATAAGDLPPGRGLMGSAGVDDTLYVAGGEGDGLRPLDDAYALTESGETLTWSRLPSLPVALSETAMVGERFSATARGGGKPGVRLLLYGGRVASGQPSGRLFSLVVRDPQASEPGPDLTGTWVTLTQKCNASGRKCKLKGSFEVRNEGELQAGRSTLAFYLSDDATLDADDTLLRQDTVSGIAPDGTVRVSIQKLKLAAGVSASGKFVIAVLDDSDQVAESDEADNTIVFGPLP